MLKQIVTLIRGQATDVVEQSLDQHSFTVLRQQIRDCAAALYSARRAIAVAMAQHEQEKSQCLKLESTIVDLETRAISALQQGKEELAKEAADTIARLEVERDASHKA